MAINEILRNRRIELGLSMKELAEKVGVSEGTISRWESGKIEDMKRSRIKALADALHISPSVIMEWEEPDSDSQPFSAQFDAGIKAMTPMDEVRTVYARNRKELSKEERMRLAAEILQDDDEDL